MAKVTPRLISFIVDSTDRSDEASSAVIASAAGDTDFMTYLQARSGGNRDYTLNMTIAQDWAAGTLYRAIWDNLGATVEGTYAPYGNETPSTDQPHLGFSVKIAEPDGDLVGAEATDSTTAVATVDVSWALLAKPTVITAAG